MNGEPVTSFVLESNLGGVPATVCACGVLLWTQQARPHMEACPILAAALAENEAQS